MSIIKILLKYGADLFAEEYGELKAIFILKVVSFFDDRDSRAGEAEDHGVRAGGDENAWPAEHQVRLVYLGQLEWFRIDSPE